MDKLNISKFPTEVQFGDDENRYYHVVDALFIPTTSDDARAFAVVSVHSENDHHIYEIHFTNHKGRLQVHSVKTDEVRPM